VVKQLEENIAGLGRSAQLVEEEDSDKRKEKVAGDVALRT